MQSFTELAQIHRCDWPTFLLGLADLDHQGLYLLLGAF